MLGDVDGDGYGDLAVGATGEDYEGHIDPGRVYVIRGGRTQPASPWMSLTPPVAYNFVIFGAGITVTGDINGDGYADVAVQSPNFPEVDSAVSTAGAVFVYYGGSEHLTGPTTLRSEHPTQSAHFGRAAAGGADLNGDGFPDLVVGEPSAMEAAGRIGRAWIFHGGPSGASNRGREIGRPATLGDRASFGAAVTLIPDPEPMIVVGVPGATARGLEEAGQVLIYRAGDVSTPAWILEATTPASGERFGAAIASAGDVNGDGTSDLLVGVRGRRMEVVLMDPVAGPGERWTLSGSDGYAARVAGIGDVNGDGLSDVAVTDPTTSTVWAWLSRMRDGFVDPPHLFFRDAGNLGTDLAGEIP